MSYFVESGSLDFPLLPTKAGDLIVSDISLTMLGQDQTGAAKKIPIVARVFDVWKGVSEVQDQGQK